MKTQSRFSLLPMPVHSLLLVLIWLLLTHSYSPGNILFALVLAVLIPLLVAPMHRVQMSMRRPWRALRFMGLVLYDVIVANLEVALLVVGPIGRLQPAFIAVPLGIEGDLPITLLASTISLTPGTVSTDISDDRKWLFVHVLNRNPDRNEVERIKARYEAPLREIFGC